jgi:RimJ/RimL family protein N-acetyltransferase
VKVLETPRLQLRWLSTDDAPFIFDLLNEPDWKRYIGDKGVDSLQAASDYIRSVPMASYERHGFGLYAVQRRSDGQLLGMCGLIRRDWLPDVDIGFALLARHAGQGWAHEAAAAVLAHARDVLGLRRIVAVTTQDNQRSQSLLERLGLRHQGMVRAPGETTDIRFYAMDLT